MDLKPQQLPATGADYKKVPLELLQARNAVAIAKSEGAEQYAPGAMQKAQDSLTQAEEYYNDKKGRTPIRTASRAATQSAEDARVLSIQKRTDERAAAERQAERDRTQAAQQQAQQAQSSSRRRRRLSNRQRSRPLIRLVSNSSPHNRRRNRLEPSNKLWRSKPPTLVLRRIAPSRHDYRRNSRRHSSAKSFVSS